MNHIFTKQLFGLAITELTALLSRRSVYCSKVANGKYSVCDAFNTPEGNIRLDRVEHTWRDGRCLYCGANEENYERGSELETHAYQFIHTEDPKELFDMKFDVIIGNPPYQLSDGGHGRSASPIYQKFVQQAQKLGPRYLTMIIPSRWFAGGKGLDEFREQMLSSGKISKLVDFQNSADVFPGVDVAGGICYFLWEKEFSGPCEVTNASGNTKDVAVRPLDEFPTFVRHSKAISIIRKVTEAEKRCGRFLNNTISSSKPFGLRGHYTPKSKGVPCWFTQKKGLQYADKKDIVDPNSLLSKWKLLIPPYPIAGQTDFSKPVMFYYEGNTRIAKPGQCCTESWLVACSFPTEREVLSFKSYLFTKTVRFLLLQTVVSQHVTRERFVFVPDVVDYTVEYTDKMLRERWNITDDEWDFIDAKIRSEGEDNEQ